jgi:hypothetical protein
MCDQLVKDIVRESFHKHASWLKQTFRMCERIKKHRTAVSDYGFEWAIQTAIGDYLIAKKVKHELRDIRLNQRYPGDRAVQPDIYFVSPYKKIIIELKAVAKCDLGYIRRKDLKKPFPNGSIVYFLIVSYPHGNAFPPPLPGTALVLPEWTFDNFRLILLRRTG